MARFGNLDGTLRAEFSIGPDSRICVRQVGNEIALVDLVTGQKKLSELIGGSGMTPDQHKVLRQLIHFIDDGPAEGFASGAYREVTGTVFPTAIVWYEDGTKAKKIVERLMTWTGANLTTDKWKIYSSADGTTVLWTITDTVNYTGIFETNRTRAIVAGDA